MSRVPASDLRADIQGLRAVAVLTVVAAHAGVPGLEGGFVGVDVFFVISGFLISSLLFRGARSAGRVPLREFYARRARRILPAATLVTVVTVIASALLLAVVDALEVVTDAWWSTLFVANVRFADVGADYFAQDSPESPLQHYWSLAVEEQFYLVWPLLLVVCLLGGRWRPRTVAAVLLVVGTASFGYGVWLTSTDPVAAYFSTPARAWELVVGALAALVAPRLAALTRLPRAALGAAGLAAIATACVVFGATTPVPGLAVALPVLGTLAVLLAGAQPPVAPRAWPARLLGSRPLRLVGDWSYSLYLWHWPLLVLPASTLDRPLPGWARALAVLAALVLAGLTHRFVETPCRTPRVRTGEPRRGAVPTSPATSTTRGLVLYPVSLVLVAVTCLTAAAWSDSQVGGDGPPITVQESDLASSGVEVSADPTVALVQASVVAARERQEIPAELHPGLLDLHGDNPDVGDCDYHHDDVRELCPHGDLDGERTLVVLGSSHGRMWIPAFDQIAERGGYRAYYLVKPSCSAADITAGQPTAGDGRKPWLACDSFREWAIEQIADLDPDLVVISTTPPGYYVFDEDGRSAVRPSDPDKVVDAYVSTFERLEELTDRVVLLRDVPRVEDHVAECLTTRGADLGTCLGTPVGDREALTEASVEAAQQAGVEVVDPRPWLCWDAVCPAVIGDTIAYRDHDHLTKTYAGELGDDLGTALGIWDE